MKRLIPLVLAGTIGALLIASFASRSVGPEPLASSSKKPACEDSLDNDGDGTIDYPADPSCIDANERDEHSAPPPPPPPPRPPPPTSNPLGLAVYSHDAEWRRYSNHDKYGLCDISFAHMDVTQRLPCVSIVYRNAVEAPIASWDNSVPYQDAINHRWVLKDCAGNLLKDRLRQLPARRWELGVSRPVCRAGEKPHCALSGHRGYFIDNVVLNVYGLTSPDQYPCKYPSANAWADAMASFAGYVGAALQGRGQYVMFNANGWHGMPTWNGCNANNADCTVAWWNKIGSYADGLMFEHFAVTPQGTIRTDGPNWYQFWSEHQRLIDHAQGLGLTSPRRRPLQTRTPTRFSTAAPHSCSTGTAGREAGISTGRPRVTRGRRRPLRRSAPLRATSSLSGWAGGGTSSGTVVLNPHPSTGQTFALGATYFRTDNGAAVTSVSLAPGQALVLRRPKARTTPAN